MRYESGRTPKWSLVGKRLLEHRRTASGENVRRDRAGADGPRAADPDEATIYLQCASLP